MVLAVSLVAEGTVVFFSASRSVQTEMNSALHVGEQTIKGGLARLAYAPDPRRGLEDLVAEFNGSRHLRVSLIGAGVAIGGGVAGARPSREESRFGAVPAWFAKLLAIAPRAVRVPATIAGKDYGTIIIETDPSNEILEVWNDLGDSLIVLTLFFGLIILLIHAFIGHILRPLGHLAAAIEQIGDGNYKMSIAESAIPELSRLQESFNRMARELADMEERQRQLNERLLTLQDEERREVARDLHDEVSPFLFAINADLAAVSRLARQGRSQEIVTQIGSTLDAVSRLQGQIRALLGRLRPGVLDDFGLSAAIMGAVEFWRRRRPETNFETELPPDGVSFGRLIDLTVYRIVQESLSNAIKHGNPAEIRVAVLPSGSDGLKPDHVTVKVSNDGAGTAEASGFGFGLTGMRERVHALGGSIALAKDVRGRLTITATVPLAHEMDRGGHRHLMETYESSHR